MSLSNQGGKKGKKGAIIPPVLISNAAPIIKPEQTTAYKAQLSQRSYRHDNNLENAQKMNEQAHKNAKNELYKQKYREAKQLSQQQMHEESFQSESSSDGEEYDDEEDELGLDGVTVNPSPKKKKKGLMGKMIGGIKKRFY